MIKITENSLRDGHQSLLATRMRTEDLLQAAEIFDSIGFHSLEVWGGATYDTCLRYLKEDPFERLYAFKKVCVKTPLQMLLRGQNLIGYRHYADDVVDEFIKLSSQAGMDIFRIFDAFNDGRNLKTSIESVKKYGKHAQGAICYTTSPVHTIQSFVEYAKELVKMGCDSIAIKDMAGLLTPFVAYDLVKALKEEIGVSLSLHTHSTAGFAFGTHLKAVEAGVDVLDLANSALSEGTSHPCTQSMVATLQGSKWDSGLDLEPMEKAAEILRKNRRKYKKFESQYNQIDTRVLLSQIPGGMISNMANQLKEQNALDRMDSVMSEIPKVRADFGYVPLVTPSSQIVGTQAVLNVLMGERYKTITTETRNVIKGLYGRTPAALNESLVKKVLGEGEKIIDVRPADLLEPELEKARQDSKEFAKSPQDVISFAIFGNIAKTFLLERNANALKPEPLESFEEKCDSKLPKDFNIVVNGEHYEIKVEGSGERTDEVRPFFIRVDGELKEVFVESIDTSLESKIHKEQKAGALPQATAPGHAKSPMPGTLTKLKVQVGDKVKLGDTLAIVEAMKMENEVLAPIDGVVKEIYATQGMQIGSDVAIMLLG
ncbi:sodium-extruding oxaloacetate decarboxylase subunit alpha [Helicobacter cinaedi]|uniref:sodium-extruding oxaloacetate decarboxylase subunit alpha n=1 Tax=Helicobacter cinaedi TaxID=213 RepID=UPI000CF10478|nr:sodium-extruding oxaloacetate decarboxylase subunit alpha [Helicobacter cinaedi]AWK61889.1 oxaloacetate decarboxylase subunit alpha [Helicobacter cinaedi]QOQ95991.1 sodium-extruding oxaloacetate decarboxylase subunit alpha [Helicobacter cinaedi]BBB19982.1 pyruvate carboxylase subunit B [Helicobacter cinaedi]